MTLPDNPKFAHLCLLADECRDFLPKEGVYDFRMNALQAQLNWIRLQKTSAWRLMVSNQQKVWSVVKLAEELKPLFWKEKERLLKIEHAEHEAQQDRQMDFVSQQRQKDQDYSITQGD